MASELRRTKIQGVFELRSHVFVDARGSFLNAFRAQEEAFISSWGDRAIAQVNISHNKVLGTIRGLHFQAEPNSEAKLVRCLKGRVWDVAVDLRIDSPSFGQWHAVELSPELSNALLVPEGCAHGFQVMQPDSELFYLHSSFWVPEAEKGVRWDDPQLAISWPLSPMEMSDRDRNLPLISDILPLY
ncbi:dTDP-4-dehydrorhamnose 3,5-epimerase [Synechococcus sp. NOUM97013]|uniref:dTDP-4-dehydrorhamnose 3,5-epimerase n=1 Tax=Synechococcus sp. NOUM97013 TaxID=1442555 RepID=UPI00164903FC|nr:dTDP-4-dehydrorhamnose 3,5-epimerase [Synechococcus sp. NOUM97013]QNI72321.1 dTDP-4-dehydrorhamnose 3/5-epimerase family protein [Synechococcus sp. NOUM97013]